MISSARSRRFLTLKSAVLKPSTSDVPRGRLIPLGAVDIGWDRISRRLNLFLVSSDNVNEKLDGTSDCGRGIRASGLVGFS